MQTPMKLFLICLLVGSALGKGNRKLRNCRNQVKKESRRRSQCEGKLKKSNDRVTEFQKEVARLASQQNPDVAALQQQLEEAQKKLEDTQNKLNAIRDLVGLEEEGENPAPVDPPVVPEPRAANALVEEESVESAESVDPDADAAAEAADALEDDDADVEAALRRILSAKKLQEAELDTQIEN